MHHVISKTLLLSTLALLVGCASYSGSNLVPGQSTQQDALANMGAPFAVHKALPGQPFTDSWEYPRGPAGRHTYMARFDAGGKLLQIDQVLSLKTAMQVKIGSATPADVRALLGRPGRITPERGGASAGEYWDYFALNLDGAPRKTLLSVSFDANGVAVAISERDDPVRFGASRAIAH